MISVMTGTVAGRPRGIRLLLLPVVILVIRRLFVARSAHVVIFNRQSLNVMIIGVIPFTLVLIIRAAVPPPALLHHPIQLQPRQNSHNQRHLPLQQHNRRQRLNRLLRQRQARLPRQPQHRLHLVRKLLKRYAQNGAENIMVILLVGVI